MKTAKPWLADIRKDRQRARSEQGVLAYGGDLALPVYPVLPDGTVIAVLDGRWEALSDEERYEAIRRGTERLKRGKDGDFFEAHYLAYIYLEHSAVQAFLNGTAAEADETPFFKYLMILGRERTHRRRQIERVFADIELDFNDCWDELLVACFTYLRRATRRDAAAYWLGGDDEVISLIGQVLADIAEKLDGYYFADIMEHPSIQKQPAEALSKRMLYLAAKERRSAEAAIPAPQNGGLWHRLVGYADAVGIDPSTAFRRHQDGKIAVEGGKLTVLDNGIKKRALVEYLMEKTGDGKDATRKRVERRLQKMDVMQYITEVVGQAGYTLKVAPTLVYLDRDCSYADCLQCRKLFACAYGEPPLMVEVTTRGGKNRRVPAAV